jgi:hypothetical protein
VTTTSIETNNAAMADAMAKSDRTVQDYIQDLKEIQTKYPETIYINK